MSFSEIGPQPGRGRIGRVWLVLASWTAVSMAAALVLRTQEGLALPYAVLGSLAWYYAVGGLVWIVCSVHRRFEVWGRPLAYALLAHAGMGLAAIGLWAVWISGFMRLSVGPDYRQLVFDDWWWQLMSTTMVYVAGLGVGLTVQNFDREHERQHREVQLEVLAREAEITAIKAQLQPHFLFNTLNSILVLIERDPGEARRMVTRLADLLNSLFDRLDKQMVPLEQELETIRDYLDIERIRFGDRLTFSIEADSGARRVPVPPFLLQPLVENAIRHGIEGRVSGGTVHVTGRLHGCRLRLSVADAGTDTSSTVPSTSGHGHGLALTRRRLQTVYGTDGATIFTNRGHGGFTVTLELSAAIDAA